MQKLYSSNLKIEDNKVVQPKKEVLNNILQFAKSYEVLQSKKNKLGVILN